MNEAATFPIVDVDDRPVPGLAERHRALAEEGRSAEEIVATLEREVQEGSLVVAQRRGVVTDLLWRLADILDGRRLVERLGVEPVELTWLVLHVPHQSKASLSWKGEGGGQASFALQVVGSGLAGGRNVSWSVAQSLGPRETSAAFTREILVALDLYETPRLAGGTVRELEVSVVGTGPARIVALPAGEPVRVAGLDRFRFEAPPDEAIDLSGYDAVVKEERKYRVSGERSFTLGVPVAKLVPLDGLKAELGAKLTASAELTVLFELAPGFVHQPYWSRRGREPLPQWGLQ